MHTHSTVILRTGMSRMLRICHGVSICDMQIWHTHDRMSQFFLFFFFPFFLVFGRAQSFDTDITSWNTGNVENMQAMFYFALRFNQPIGVWDVSSVVSIFMNDCSLKSKYCNSD